MRTILIEKSDRPTVKSDRRRFQYEDQLRIGYTQIIHQEGNVNNPHYDYWGINSTISPKIRQKIMTALAAQLDETLIIFLDQELQAHQNSIDSIQKKLIEDKTALAKQMALAKCTADFTRSINIMISRINKDWHLLQNGFLAKLTNPKLIDIAFTGSDFHRYGQQVLILSFQGDNGITEKIVYKPSSVMADAMILGDIKRLRQFDNHFAGKFSFIEKWNEIAPQDEHSALSQIPTYLIVPRTDETNTYSVDLGGRYYEQYGYIEYLTHSPQFSIDDAFVENRLHQLFSMDKLQTLPKSRINDKVKQAQRIISEEVEQAQKNAIFSAAQNSDPENSDCIINTNAELSRYSHDCGILLALMTILAITDSHLENAIVHKKRVRLIDVETCLQPSFTDPNDSSALNYSSGSLNGLAKTGKLYSIFVDGIGKIEISLQEGQKNRLYFLTESEQLIVCQPDSEKLTYAYDSALKLMSDNHDIFLAWFDQDAVRNMHLRIIPEQTALFQSWLTKYSKEQVRHHLVDTQNPESTLKVDFERRVARGESRYENQNNLQELIIPFESVFAEMNREEIFELCRHRSVPVYHMHADGLKLYGSNGVAIAPLVNSDYTTFLKKSPLAITKENAKIIFSQPSVQENLVKNVNHVVSRFLNQCVFEIRISLLVDPDNLKNAQIGFNNFKKNYENQFRHPFPFSAKILAMDGNTDLGNLSWDPNFSDGSVNDNMGKELTLFIDYLTKGDEPGHSMYTVQEWREIILLLIKSLCAQGVIFGQASAPHGSHSFVTQEGFALPVNYADYRLITTQRWGRLEIDPQLNAETNLLCDVIISISDLQRDGIDNNALNNLLRCMSPANLQLMYRRKIATFLKACQKAFNETGDIDTCISELNSHKAKITALLSTEITDENEKILAGIFSDFNIALARFKTFAAASSSFSGDTLIDSRGFVKYNPLVNKLQSLLGNRNINDWQNTEITLNAVCDKELAADFHNSLNELLKILNNDGANGLKNKNNILYRGHDLSLLDNLPGLYDTIKHLIEKQPRVMQCLYTLLVHAIHGSQFYQSQIQIKQNIIANLRQQANAPGAKSSVITNFIKLTETDDATPLGFQWHLFSQMHADDLAKSPQEPVRSKAFFEQFPLFGRHRSQTNIPQETLQNVMLEVIRLSYQKTLTGIRQRKLGRNG